MFFVYCLVVVVVVIFFLFYFNRALGQALAWILNQYLWRKYQAYIEIGMHTWYDNFAINTSLANLAALPYRVVSICTIRRPNIIQKRAISQHKSVNLYTERSLITAILAMGCAT